MAPFVIVSGPPASGKSHLARHLGDELRLPVISKDAIKERLMDRLGNPPAVGDATFDVQFAIARELARAGGWFILEGAFFRNQEELRELAAIGEAIVIDVTAELSTLERRYAEREEKGARHPGHRGLEALPDLRRRIEQAEYGVPDVGRPVLRVDTTDGTRPSEEEIVAWVRRQLGPAIVTTERPAHADLRKAWDQHSDAWARWAREPGHDSYWRFARDAFFPLLPAPGRLTLDLGCGEGRVSRDLIAARHHVIGMDGSPRMARAARTAAADIPVAVADAARLPFGDGSFDLVVAYMTLHDFDDLNSSAMEIARVLEDGGTLCAGVVHPLNSAGEFSSGDDEAPFVIRGSYAEPSFYVDHVERGGLEMTFASRHHPLEEYFNALSQAGLAVETLREIYTEGHWSRVPMFLFIRAIKR
jgi:SAM-dependent methyltransferase/predicted kinase